jgi:hypothetical protein
LKFGVADDGRAERARKILNGHGEVTNVKGRELCGAEIL